MCDDEPSKKRTAGTNLLAVAEVSLQIPNGKTAPPIPLPMWLKKVSIAQVFRSRMRREAAVMLKQHLP